MDVGRTVRMWIEATGTAWLTHGLAAAGAATTLGVVVLVALSVRAAPAKRDATLWLAHHRECDKLPEELYHRDRFRAIRGHAATATTSASMSGESRQMSWGFSGSRACRGMSLTLCSRCRRVKTTR
jgi:hypothetical protein